MSPIDVAPLLVRAAALAAALLASGCGAFAPGVAPDITAGLAGRWAGWMTIGRLGNGPASMTVSLDGRFEGSLRLEDEERPFRGALTALGSGALRYGGTFGDGTATVAEQADRRTMTLVPDGGGGVATFAQVR